jgi:hypothetical protein
MMQRLVRPHLDDLLKPARNFQTGESMDRIGREAMLWLAVPAMALGTTLLGAFWHIGKLIGYIGILAGPRLYFLRRSAATIPAMLIFLTALSSNNVVAQSPSLRNLEGQPMGPVWLIERISIGGGPLLYHLGNTIRKVALGGYDFGYDPFADPSRSERSPLNQLIPQ